MISFWIFKGWKNPEPLPRSKNIKKELMEVGLFISLELIYIILAVFIFSSFSSSPIVQITRELLNILTSFFIPFLYLSIKDKWTCSDFGLKYNFNNWMILFPSIFYGTYHGILNPGNSNLVTLLVLLFTNVIYEEFIYRGVIQSKLERVFKQNIALILQGIIFMLIHVPKFIFELLVDSNVIWFYLKLLIIFFSGIVYGLIYLKTRTIWISVICHYLYNYFGVILLFFI